MTGHRVTRFLAARGRVAGPVPQAGMDEAAVTRLAATVPACFRAEADAWIRVLRGEGTRPSRAMGWKTIRSYLGYVLPALHQWHRQQVTSLLEISTQHVMSAIGHPPDRAVHSGLRSLFRALKRERLIFRDPARTISLPAARCLGPCPPAASTACWNEPRPRWPPQPLPSSPYTPSAPPTCLACNWPASTGHADSSPSAGPAATTPCSSTS